MTAWVWVGGRGKGSALVGVRVQVLVRCATVPPLQLCRVVLRLARRARARDHAGVRATECERELQDSTALTWSNLPARLSNCVHLHEDEHTRISTLSILAFFTCPRSAGVRGDGTWQGLTW